MRYFFSTGEASGETAALLLAGAIAQHDPDARFEGIGGARMREAGFSLWRDHTGWASMGPLAAIPRIPKLLATMLRTALHLRRNAPDLLILVDFGAFNLRLAQTLRRRLGYRAPILDVFPPGTWLDSEEKARKVSALTVPLTAFAHQHEFYRSRGLPIVYFGHPLAGEFAGRSARVAAPVDGGTIAILPGSRDGELRRHLPVLIDAFALLRARRPHARAIFGAADAQAEATIRAALDAASLGDATVVRGARAALEQADAAWVASGTAVLETLLAGVPAVALYIITPVLVKLGRKMIKHNYITLPNLVLGRALVPELLQEAATPQRLASELDGVLRDPASQTGAIDELRAALGPADALDRCAQFAVALAKAGRS